MSEPTTIAEVVAAAGRATLAALAERNAPVAADHQAEPQVTPEVPAALAPDVAAGAAPEVAPEGAPAVAPAQDKAMTFKAVCVEDRGVIMGIGGSIAVDKQGEDVEKGALIGLAYDFCASAERTFRPNHDQHASIDADLVESWLGEPVLKSGRVLAPGEAVPQDDPIDVSQCRKGAETHWFITVKPHDAAVLEAARKGELVGFSWGGFARKVTA